MSGRITKRHDADNLTKCFKLQIADMELFCLFSTNDLKIELQYQPRRY
jgi:hypothetical protein